ncbi:MAG: carboxypeptidase-like regulatory domain-containing protein [Chitinispirillales bacterium]|nr:carboxypeptidase-like regulatory domain-containing protein [Chitinispirillales bacterium]
MKKYLNVFCTLAVASIFLVSCAKEEFDNFGGIHGTVTDKFTGEPIVNASVLLSPDGTNRLTDWEGNYQFTNLEPGQYSVNVQHIDYKTDRNIVTVRVGESALVNFLLTVE